MASAHGADWLMAPALLSIRLESAQMSQTMMSARKYRVGSQPGDACVHSLCMFVLMPQAMWGGDSKLGENSFFSQDST